MSELPGRPDIRQLRRQARELLRAALDAEPQALSRLRAVSERVTLSAAQLALAREHGFPSWPALRAEVERRSAAELAEAVLLAEPFADQVVFDFQLSARSFPEPGQVAPALPPAHAPAGRYFAVPVGAAVPVTVDGRASKVLVHALAGGPDRVLLSVTARLAGTSGPRRRPRDLVGYLESLNATAADDRGGRYALRQSGGIAEGAEWSGMFVLDPALPPGTGWLDLAFGPGVPPVRVQLDQLAPPAGRCLAPPAGTAAERLLDRVAESLLFADPLSQLMQYDYYVEDPAPLGDLVTALRAAGAVADDSPALARLFSLARETGVGFTGDLAPMREVELPAAWRDVLEHRGDSDGPQAELPVAVVLPELDGTRCVIAGLSSAPQQATLRVHAWGWPRRPRPDRPDRHPFTWWARDDMGRWHIGAPGTGGYSAEHSDFDIVMTPPLHPGASQLEITVTGQDGQVSVTAPLDWPTLL